MEDADLPRGPPDDVVAAAFPDQSVRIVRQLEGRATNGVHELVASGDRVVLKTADWAGWRLEKEAAILRELAPVAGLPVPDVIDCGMAGDMDYLAMEFCEGPVAANAVTSGTLARFSQPSAGCWLVSTTPLGFSRAGNPVADDGSLHVGGSGDWVGHWRSCLTPRPRSSRTLPLSRWLTAPSRY